MTRHSRPRSGGRSGASRRGRRSRRFTVREARRRQRLFWDDAFRTEASWTDRTKSPMAQWALRVLPVDGHDRRFIELGCGSGRDLLPFIQRGYRVAAVDLSPEAVRIARRRSLTVRRPPGAPRPVVDRADILEFLATQPGHSADAVLSNLVLTMGYPRSYLQRVFREVRRVLRPGGLHLYSVRTREDRWFRRGTPIGEDLIDPGSHGPPLRFFSRDELDRARRGFVAVGRRFGSEERGLYRRSVAYVIDRTVGPSPPASR